MSPYRILIVLYTSFPGISSETARIVTRFWSGSIGVVPKTLSDWLVELTDALGGLDEITAGTRPMKNDSRRSCYPYPATPRCEFAT